VKLTLDDDNQTFSNVDTGSGRFCLAGLVRGADAETQPARTVSFEYRSIGSIEKANQKQVRAEFDDVSVTLTIEEGGVQVFSGTSPSCKLKGLLRKGGDSQKVRVRCDAGNDLGGFGLPLEYVDSVDDAFRRQKHIRVDATKGKVRIRHVGAPAPSGVPVSLSCDLTGS
jgi:hypothetical protein